MADQKNKQQKMPHRHPEKPTKKNDKGKNPDEKERKKIEIEDDPNEVKRKIPNMHK